MSKNRVISLSNQKGGVGKSITAASLGFGLTRQGKKVLLIDGDAQASLIISLGFTKPDELPVTLATVMSAIIEEKPFEPTLGIISHPEGVDLMPSGIELSGIEVALFNALYAAHPQWCQTCLLPAQQLQVMLPYLRVVIHQFIIAHGVQLGNILIHLSYPISSPPT